MNAAVRHFDALPSVGWRWWMRLGVLVMVIGAMVLGLSVGLASAELSYRLDADALRIDAHKGVMDDSDTLPRRSIQRAERLQVRESQRVGGTATPSYCGGRWRINGEWAHVATRCGHDTVAVHTTEGLWVLEPADPEALVSALSSGGEGDFAAPPLPPDDGRPWALLLLLPLGAAPLALLRTMRYRIEDGVLVVPAHFRAVRVPLSGARLRPGPLGRAMRWGGSGMPGFYLGLFREGGAWVHVAATDTEGLWVEGERRLFISPADLPAFIEAARKAGATVP